MLIAVRFFSSKTPLPNGAPQSKRTKRSNKWSGTDVRRRGMLFECETDRFLLTALGGVQDDLPIGEAQWIIVILIVSP